jgi:hypothetical protein
VALCARRKTTPARGESHGTRTALPRAPFERATRRPPVGESAPFPILLAGDLNPPIDNLHCRVAVEWARLRFHLNRAGAPGGNHPVRRRQVDRYLSLWRSFGVV